MSLKIKKLNKFDLIQNSKTIFNGLNKSRKFADYPDQASRIYFNLKRSGLTPSEFSSETKIPKNIVVLLGSMKKPDGDYWPELQLKILEVDKLIDQNIKKYNDCISLLENCPIECGYRKYSVDIVKLIFNVSKDFNFLNTVGFDLAQFDNWNSLIQTTQIVEKDIKKAKKIKSQKIVQSFINDEVVVGIKNSIPNLDLSKISNKLKIVEDYRKLSIKADNYSFKQFCTDCGLEDKFKSLNYYYLNFEKVKEKQSATKSTIKKGLKKPLSNFELQLLNSTSSELENEISQLKERIENLIIKCDEQENIIISLNNQKSSLDKTIEDLKISVDYYKASHYKLVDHLSKIKQLADIVK